MIFDSLKIWTFTEEKKSCEYKDIYFQNESIVDGESYCKRKTLD